MEQFRDLITTTTDTRIIHERLRRDFRIMRSVGWDNKGTVLFTGYFTPIVDASLTKTDVFKYPLYKRPKDFISVSLFKSLQKLPDGTTRPYPGRTELETSGALNGLELVYFKDPFTPYVIQVQGSAKVRLRDGREVNIGNHGTTGHQYVGIGAQMVADGIFAKHEQSLQRMRQYFNANPHTLKNYTKVNQRFVFFTITKDGPYGKINEIVEKDVTIATDKEVFPPGALTFVDTSVGVGRTVRRYSSFRLDQDAGGAIQAPRQM